MSKRSRVVEDEFDDDEKVEYLDCDETDAVSNAEQGARTPRRDKSSARFKPLFQQKRYKGDLEAEKYGELFDIEEFVSKAKARPAVDEGIEDQPAFEAVSSPVGRKISKGPKSREASSAHVGRSSEDTRAAKSARDVADDRPAHWNRLRMAPARTATRKPTNTTRGAAAINPGTAAKPVRPIQIPKPKALPAPTVTPAGAGNGNAPTAVSFKPSWMTTSRSSGAVAMQCNVGSGSTMRTAAALNGELSRPGVVAADSPVIPVAALEDIQDDTLSPVRPFTTPAHGSRGLQFNSGATQMPAGAMDDGPGEAYTRHSLGAQEGRNAGALFLSPERQQSSLRYEYGMDSGERAPGSGMLHRTASTRGGSKARPGSLKAKLLKIQRDGDAAENRIVNVPVDKSSRAVDLQDPRQRAVRYVDAELVAVLEDRAPFKVVRLEVVGRWCKGGVESSANHSEAPVGSALLGYFKPDSCTGQGRGLVVGLRLRVCDGLVVKSGAEHRLLCTGCWEPLADD